MSTQTHSTAPLQRTPVARIKYVGGRLASLITRFSLSRDA